MIYQVKAKVIDEAIAAKFNDDRSAGRKVSRVSDILDARAWTGYPLRIGVTASRETAENRKLYFRVSISSRLERNDSRWPREWPRYGSPPSTSNWGPLRCHSFR